MGRGYFKEIDTCLEDEDEELWGILVFLSFVFIVQFGMGFTVCVIFSVYLRIFGIKEYRNICV